MCHNALICTAHCSLLCARTAGEHSGAHLRAAGAVGRGAGGDGVAAARDALGLVLLRGRRARHAQQGGLLVPRVRRLRRAAAAASGARDRRRLALTSDLSLCSQWAEAEAEAEAQADLFCAASSVLLSPLVACASPSHLHSVTAQTHERSRATLASSRSSRPVLVLLSDSSPGHL